MSQFHRRKSEPQAYTGETIVMRTRGGGTSPPSKPVVRKTPPRGILSIVRGTLKVAIVLALVAVVLIYVLVFRVASQIVVHDVRPNAPVSSLFTGGMNVLIVGVDERDGHPEEGVRSDTLIVAHLNTYGRWVNLLSIPRDTLVTIPNVGEDKINVAYGQGYATAETLYGLDTTPQEGGMASAAQAVERLLGWPGRGQRIDAVVQVNFDGFAKIIDAIGGVTIDVPKHIVDDAYPTDDFGTRRVEFQPGPQRMDGQTALIYARTRHADSDFDRGARQQQVIRAVISELKQRGPLGLALVLPRLSDGLKGTVETTMPIARPDTLLGLIWLSSGINPDEINQVRLSPEIDPQYVQDANFNLIWSQQGIHTAIDEFLTPPSEAGEAARVQVLNGTGETGLAGRITGDLENQGFSVIPAGDAPTTDVSKTIIYDVTNKPRTSQHLANLLHATVKQGAPASVTSTADIVVVLGKDAQKP